MYILQCLLFAISASLDAFVVGISYGIKKVSISKMQNLIISLSAMLGTYLSIEVGSLLLCFFPSVILSNIGRFILIIWGLYYLLSGLIFLFKDWKNKATTIIPTNNNKYIPLNNGTLLMLCISLSLNNVGIGISASMAGLNFFTPSIATFVFSYLFLYFGNKKICTKMKNSKTNSSYSNIITGILLIFLGMLKY